MIVLFQNGYLKGVHKLFNRLLIFQLKNRANTTYLLKLIPDHLKSVIVDALWIITRERKRAG